MRIVFGGSRNRLSSCSIYKLYKLCVQAYHRWASRVFKDVTFWYNDLLIREGRGELLTARVIEMVRRTKNSACAYHVMLDNSNTHGGHERFEARIQNEDILMCTRTSCSDLHLLNQFLKSLIRDFRNAFNSSICSYSFH